MKRTGNIKAVARLTGRRGLMFSSLLAIALAALFAGLLMVLAFHLDVTWEMRVDSLIQVSERTRAMLADTQGHIRITCFMDRRHPMFRPVSRLLRGLRQAARGVAGAEIVIQYVDPRWDLARAGQLAAQGVPENALVFERQRRRIIATLDEMLHKQSPLVAYDEIRPGNRAQLGVFRGESVCAAAIARLSRSLESATAYWLQGHGEARYDDDSELRGFSVIAREIRRNGFELKPLMLSGLEGVPEECRVLIVAGARYALNESELAMIDGYLRGGGRLMWLAGAEVDSGVESMLASWGIMVKPFVATGPQTISGGELVVGEFSDHVITRALKGASAVFGRSLCIAATGSDKATTGADLPKVTLLVGSGSDGWGESMPEALPRRFDSGHDLPGPVAVAAASERGGSVASDVAFNPTRICVFGEADFVMNGVLASRANANRDLFMNALAWLAGIDTGGAPSLGGDTTLVTGFTRRQWLFFMAGAAGALPLVVFLIFCATAIRRRR